MRNMAAKMSQRPKRIKGDCSYRSSAACGAGFSLRRTSVLLLGLPPSASGRDRLRPCGSRRRGGFCANHPQRFPQFEIDLLAQVGIVLQQLLDVLAALSDPLALVAVPGAAFFNHVLSRAQID